MTRTESAIIMARVNLQDNILNHCRLLRTTDPFQGNDVFSLFLTTRSQTETDEEFVFDIARDGGTASEMFDLICKENVTACTLRDVIADLLAEQSSAMDSPTAYN